MKRLRIESRSNAINSKLTETKATLRSHMKERILLSIKIGNERGFHVYMQLHGKAYETGKT